MGTVWKPTDDSEERFPGKDRATGEQEWTASRVDLIYGSNSQLCVSPRNTPPTVANRE